MNKKNMQKINRAAVAGVLAASGVAVTMPFTNVQAASPFSDLETDHTHYSAIKSLYDRGIISGFPNGEFRQGDSVTRGQAAKMLALILNLDTKNITNPGFRDVSKNNSNYAYIAALVENGVINGYSDKTFRPSEPITRSQMAKILVRGFNFMEATSLTHTFTDVSSKNANRFYIQTLVNLGITNGTTAVTFSPSKAVTRGQLASFLIRAENANVSTASIKEVTKIEQLNGVTYVYLNGLKHTVSSDALKNIFTVANAEVLKGAYVTGTISGTDIRSVSKLTINAKGASNNILKFNGAGSTFTGDVDITGNYLRFTNWNIAGKVTIKEASITAFSNIIKPLQMKTIASLTNNVGFIDWGQTTDPNENVWENDGEADEELVDIPTDTTAKAPKMKNVAKQIEFIGSTIQELKIFANRTRITSDRKLPHVTVAGFVSEFEIIANIRALYLDSDNNTTFYGDSNIDTLYKNGYKSVNLFADSIVGLMVVDNAYGWIDLGDYFFIDKAVIPVNKMPNDIFNDFLNDSDKIADLEDPSGKDIDRDPIENTIVPDWEAPTFSIENIETELATATITVNSSEDGTVHYLVKKEIDGEPSIREIMQYTGPMGGYKAVSEGVDTDILIENLEDEQTYIFYAVAVDEAGNVSVKNSEKFEIVDATPPKLDPISATGLPGGTRIEVTMTPNEGGEYYYYYEPTSSLGANKYTSNEIIDYAATNYRRQTGTGTVDEAGQMSFRITGLEATTSYSIYVVMKDEAGNIMSEPKVLTPILTKELDDVYPYVTDAVLNRVNKDAYEFEVSVNEELDPTTANNINNYEISGTAIINVDGQPTTIKPDFVEYIAGQKKIKFRVPSATALVNGDTILVKILPGVTDLAENPFVNINVVTSADQVKNTATYIHNDTVSPVLTIEKFEKNPLKTNGILTYKANKAGTYYYMIVPNSYNMTGVTPRDFYNEFTSEAKLNIPNLSKVGDNGNNTVIVGSQTQSVVLPTATDPFESYTLYMVMKDRSGQLSAIQSEKNIIDDSKAPYLRQLKVEAEDGSNTGVKITVKASEAGKIYYTRFKKKSTDAAEIAKMNEITNTWPTKFTPNVSNINAINDEDAKKYVEEIRSWKNSDLTAETTNEFFDRNLAAHSEYVYFFAVEDLFGNITMYPSTMLTDSTVTASNEGYGSRIIKSEVYTDGIKPFLNNEKNVLKLITQQEFKKIPLQVTSGTAGVIGDGYIEHKPQQTFTLTFSEAIKYVGTDGLQNATADSAVLAGLKAALETKLSTLTITDMEWQKTAALNTWNERQLIFTVSTAPTANITIDATTLAAFRDLAVPAKEFDIDKTKVEYKAKTSTDANGLREAVLTGEITSGNTVSVSKSLLAIMEINSNINFEQTYYYIVQGATNSRVFTGEEIINIANSVSDADVTGITTFGKGQLVDDITQLTGSGNGTSFQLELIAAGNNNFQTGQKLHLITIDKYGNITNSYSTNSGTSYEIIKTLN